MIHQNSIALTMSEILDYLYQFEANQGYFEDTKSDQCTLIAEIKETRSLIDLCSLLERWIIQSQFIPDRYCINKIMVKLGAFGEKAFAEQWYGYSQVCGYTNAENLRIK